MANLDIKNASFGMNTDKTEQYIEDIKDTVLKEAGKELIQKTKDLDEQLSAVWQGNARDSFYKIIKGDAELLSKKLEDLVEELEKGFTTTRDSLDAFDKGVKFQSIVK